YHALFNSEADAPGRNNWLNHMANGMSRTYILSGFVGSDGFRNLCGQYGIKLGTVNLTQNRDQNTVATAFVHRLYIHALGRTTVSEADLNSRVGDLRSNKITAANMLKEIFSSDEYKGRNLDNAEFVHASYKTLYGRDARDAELGQKLSYLNAHSTQDLLAVLIDSSEFKTICAAAGITSGSLTQSKAVYNILDVSAYQNTINWSAVAASGKVDGVMIRAVSTSNTSNGPYVDPYFAANVIGAKRAGLKVGVYYVLYGQNIGECASEVNLMLSEIAKLEAQGYYIDLPVACDLEYNTGKLSAGYLTTLGRYSMDLIELAGYYPLLYTGANFSQNSLNLSEIGNRDLWIAWYPYLLHNSIVYGIKGTPYENVLAPIEATPCTKSGNPTNPATVGVNSYSIWQYRSDANISGINGKVDINYAYKDYATILATTTRSDGTKWNHLK
ncbi:MAG: DUF4214 domain-containing protein, partial [Ruminococcaceae bacterium]|nr:DUF4214 domain-containing protein [Oscillospiraceae bacterium]